jgi:WD40 repeat protein
MAGVVLVASSLLGAVYVSGWFSSAPEHNTFVQIGDMTTARWNPTATLLVDGRVLVAGGVGNGTGYGLGGGPTLDSAELFDPKTDRFTATAPMTTARQAATSALLPNGQVLVAGGGTASAELYDPTTGKFSPTGSMSHSRCGALSVALQDGRVLVVGGGCDEYDNDNSSEVYDPATGQFRSTGSLSTVWSPSSAIRLKDGRVLVAGGVDWETTERVSFANIYEPGTGQFSATGPLPTPQDGAAALLPDGRVLIAGGCGNGFDGPLTTSSAELYDPASGSFRRTGPMQTTVCGGQSARLASGSVLVFGWDAEVYDPTTGTFHIANGGATSYGSSVTPLTDGRILVAGGWSEDDYAPALPWASLYLP